MRFEQMYLGGSGSSITTSTRIIAACEFHTEPRFSRQSDLRRRSDAAGGAVLDGRRIDDISYDGQGCSISQAAVGADRSDHRPDRRRRPQDRCGVHRDDFLAGAVEGDEDVIGDGLHSQDWPNIRRGSNVPCSAGWRSRMPSCDLKPRLPVSAIWRRSDE